MTEFVGTTLKGTSWQIPNAFDYSLQISGSFDVKISIQYSPYSKSHFSDNYGWYNMRNEYLTQVGGTDHDYIYTFSGKSFYWYILDGTDCTNQNLINQIKSKWTFCGYSDDYSIDKTTNIKYNNNLIATTSGSNLPVTYNGTNITTLSSDGTKTLEVQGCLMQHDIGVGSKTLEVQGCLMQHDIVLETTELTYNITPTLTHVTASASNPTTITRNSTATLTFTAEGEYILPSSVSVTGATGTWTQATGTLVLSNPISDVTFSITGSEEPEPTPSTVTLSGTTAQTSILIAYQSYRINNGEWVNWIWSPGSNSTTLYNVSNIQFRGGCTGTHYENHLTVTFNGQQYDYENTNYSENVVSDMFTLYGNSTISLYNSF